MLLLGENECIIFHVLSQPHSWISSCHCNQIEYSEFSIKNLALTQRNLFPLSIESEPLFRLDQQWKKGIEGPGTQKVSGHVLV